MRTAIGRRGFLRRAAGLHRSVTLSCASLYVQYVDAAAVGRLDDFVSALEWQIGSAKEIYLADREWLAREDFRRTLDHVFASCGARPLDHPPSTPR